MTTKPGVLSDKNTVYQLSKKNNEPDWLLEIRLSAFEKASELPLPKPEKTNIEKWNFNDFEYSSSSQSYDNLLEGKEDNNFLQVDNVVKSVSLSQELANKGVIFTDFNTAVKEHEELVKRYFLKEPVQTDEHKLSALHTALFDGGLFLYVPRNVEVDVPLDSVFFLTEGKGMFPYVLIIAEDNSKVELVSSITSKEGALSNSFFDVFVGNNAKVNVSTLNNLSETAVDVTYRRSLVGNNAELTLVTAHLGDGKNISDNLVNLKGEGSKVQVYSVALGSKNVSSNITSSIYHWGRHTASDIQARAVMKDSSTGILNSITKIEKGASKSDGQQSSKVLMLDKEARGDANPILLIDENDVTAGHAASVGRVDPLQLFYLMSRGISKEKAQELVIYGFLDAVVSKLPTEKLRNQVTKMIEGKFSE